MTLNPFPARFTPSERERIALHKASPYYHQAQPGGLRNLASSLALSVPAVLQVQSVIVYTETAYNPKNSESSIAQSIVSKEFSISQGSSVVVVITSTDVRGNDVRDFTLSLNKTLHNDRTITNLSNVTSIYDIYYQLLVGYTSEVHLQLYQKKNLTSLATSLEFGIPTIYVSQWTTLVNSGPFNINQSQLAAYNQKANQSAWH